MRATTRNTTVLGWETLFVVTTGSTFNTRISIYIYIIITLHYIYIGNIRVPLARSLYRSLHWIDLGGFGQSFGALDHDLRQGVKEPVVREQGMAKTGEQKLVVVHSISAISWWFMDVYGCLLMLMDVHGCLQMFIDVCGCLWPITNYGTLKTEMPLWSFLRSPRFTVNPNSDSAWFMSKALGWVNCHILLSWNVGPLIFPFRRMPCPAGKTWANLKCWAIWGFP